MKSPIIFVWKQTRIIGDYGEVENYPAMIPLKRYITLATKEFEFGKEYPLITNEYRSSKEHAFFFMAIDKGWQNLPEDIAARFPSQNHLRRWLLIQLGYCDEKEWEFQGSDAAQQARRLGHWIRTEDDYATISIHSITAEKCKVIVRRAKSQAKNAMPLEDFRASCKAVLDELEHMLGVPIGSLLREAKKHE